MARRVDCPWPKYEDAYIELPDEWLGLHARRRDEAVDAAGDRTRTLREFAVSLAILDDWHLPGLNGNPEKWDFEKMPLELIAWVNDVTITDFAKCFVVPKVSSPPLTDG